LLYNLFHVNKKKLKNKQILADSIGLLLAIGIYYLPPVHSRLETRVDLLRTRIVYFFNPPAKPSSNPAEKTPYRRNRRWDCPRRNA
jgi:hypothetical protein